MPCAGERSGPLVIFFTNDLLKTAQVGSADDLDAAQLQMRQFALEKPGWYFIWDPKALRVIARLDTTKPSAMRG